MDLKIAKSKRYSSLDEHPQKEQIIRDIIAQKSYNDIKKTYGIDSVKTIKTFISNRILFPAAQANTEAKQDSRELVMAKLDEIQGYLSKLIKSCDEWLTDPDLPDKYFLGDRADEVYVVYTEEIPIGDSGKTKTVRRKEKLQKMVDAVMDSPKYFGSQLEYVQTNRTDTRKLMLDALRVAQQQVELIAKITGEMHEITMAVDVYGVVLPHVISIVQKATDGRPDIQKQIYEGLAEIADIHDTANEKGY